MNLHAQLPFGKVIGRVNHGVSVEDEAERARSTMQLEAGTDGELTLSYRWEITPGEIFCTHLFSLSLARLAYGYRHNVASEFLTPFARRAWRVSSTIARLDRQKRSTNVVTAYVGCSFGVILVARRIAGRKCASYQELVRVVEKLTDAFIRRETARSACNPSTLCVS